MRVKHGTMFRVVITCGLAWHDDPCEDAYVPAEFLDGMLTRVAAMHGKVSGHDSGIRVKQRVSLVDPTDELTGDQLCDCKRCTEGEDADARVHDRAQRGH